MANREVYRKSVMRARTGAYRALDLLKILNWEFFAPTQYLMLRKASALLRRAAIECEELTAELRQPFPEGYQLDLWDDWAKQADLEPTHDEQHKV